MNKFNRIIVLSLIIYLAAAVSFGVIMHKMSQREDNSYMISLNRAGDRAVRIIQEGIDTSPAEGDFAEDALWKLANEYDCIDDILYFPISETNYGDELDDLYKTKAGKYYEIIPVIDESDAGQVLKGYLRINYDKEDNSGMIFVIAELIFLLIGICILSVLIYLKFKLIAPFNRMQDMTYELSKGNLKGDIKSDKNKYFGRFALSLSQLRDNLDAARSREYELLRERKMLLFSISHDVKTPLSTVQLYLRALSDNVYDTEEKRQEVYGKIMEKAHEIENYINELVKASHEDVVDIQVEQGEFYLGNLMEQVLHIYREKCALRKTELKVGDYGNILLKGDIHRMTEVFENIFENAFKYGDGRKIEISFYREDYSQLIRVFNTGECVEEKDFPHLFESFYRASNSKGKRGSGLGLYICREIMHRMNGEIFAESGEGGMAFVIVMMM